MEKVFRILGEREWDTAQNVGVLAASPLDRRDGYMHLSLFEDVVATVNLHFTSDQAPVALEINVTELGEDLRLEEVPSRGNRRFPHLYAPLIRLSAVRAVYSLPHRDERFYLGVRREYWG